MFEKSIFHCILVKLLTHTPGNIVNITECYPCVTSSRRSQCHSPVPHTTSSPHQQLINAPLGTEGGMVSKKKKKRLHSS